MSLVPVHGGLTNLVDRVLPWSKRPAMLAEAKNLPKILVTDADLSAVYRYSDGTLSPLNGPMDEEDWNDVLTHRAITRGGEKYAWTIPMALPVTDAEAAAVKAGHPAALYNSDGELVGILNLTESSLAEPENVEALQALFDEAMAR